MSKQDQPARQARVSLEELEDMLKYDEDVPIEILPSGEIVRTGDTDREHKPLTYRENLGGEYGAEL